MSAPTSAAEATVVGLMSGTSLDGVSAAVAHFRESDDRLTRVELLCHVTVPYTERERNEILQVIEKGDSNSICRLNFGLGERFAAAADDVIRRSGVPRQSIAAIASHGQTIWHVPAVATLQIGEPAVIAERLGLPVISDFRVRDVAAEGQGAPLVPIADALLFSAPSHWRAIQNIGGMGNVSVVPPGGNPDAVVAFDTGPGMVVIDAVVERMTGGHEHIDRDARFSRGGRAVMGAVQEALEQPFFSQPPPKSTGRELFSGEFVARFIDRCRELEPSASDSDVVASAVALTARSIVLSYRRFVTAPIDEVLLSGGGAKHPLLRAELSRELAPKPVRDFGEVFFDAEAKEAVAFALLGFLHLRGRAGNVPSATGAIGGRILGKLTPA